MSRRRSLKNKKLTPSVCGEPDIATNMGMYPDINSIMKDYKKSEHVCSFCKLPANFIHELGDLYGPYYPTVEEVIDIHDSSFIDSKICLSNMVLYDCSSAKIIIDVINKQCFIPVSVKPCSDGNIHDRNLSSVKSLQEDILNKTQRLRLYQIVDAILCHKPMRNGKLLLPGFTGKIKILGELKSTGLIDVIDSLIFYNVHQSINHTLGFPISALNKSDENSELWYENSQDSSSHIKKIHVEKLWTHMHCAVWAPGVYCVNTQMFGIYSAVNHSENALCKYCGRSGATISQFGNKRDMFHYLCAVINNVDFESQSFLNNEN